MSDIKNNIIFECFDDTFMYLLEPIKQLNLTKLNIKLPKNVGFKTFVSYSYDKRNYSAFQLLENVNNVCIDENEALYVCVWFKRIRNTDLTIPTSLYDKAPTKDKYFGGGAYLQNVDQRIQSVIIEELKYDGHQLTSNDIEFKEVFELVDEFPRFNLYDNQQISVERWLHQCNAIAEMYGHTAIYFKTEPLHHDEENSQTGIHGIHYQLQNNVIRNVVDIKRLHILAPNNELPQDRNVYTEWDMPLQDDFIIHIVRQKFEQAFGLKAIPNEKDYIYLPIINKLFRVSTMQPKNGFMGVIGWYEVFLSKYEDDDSVRIDNSLKDAFSGIPDFDDAITEGEQEGVFEQIDTILDDTLYDNKQDVVEEQKQATENYTNKLEDTTFYVTLKETEKLREAYDSRLEIVSVNPEDSMFPITMYNCTAVDRRVIAMRYNLTDYNQTNKFVNRIKESYSLSFNFCELNRFSGEIFDILTGTNSITTIAVKNRKMYIFDTACQVEGVIDFIFENNELYQVNIDFDFNIKQYSIKIFKLVNRQKTLVYQNIYKMSKYKRNQSEIFITNINMYGGKYLLNDLVFKIDGQKFIDDKCLPLLNMAKF